MKFNSNNDMTRNLSGKESRSHKVSFPITFMKWEHNKLYSVLEGIYLDSSRLKSDGEVYVTVIVKLKPGIIECDTIGET